MPERHLTALLLLLTLALTGCPPPPPEEAYVEVGVAFTKLHRDPAQACAYVAATASSYDTRFAQCASSQATRLSEEIDRLQAECDAIFVDPYDKLKCDEDRGVPALHNRLYYLLAMMEITTGTSGCAVVSCNCQQFGDLFQSIVDIFNSTVAPGSTWQDLMDANLESTKTEFAC